jgi:NADH-quinone oxidoreductase subunit B
MTRSRQSGDPRQESGHGRGMHPPEAALDPHFSMDSMTLDQLYAFARKHALHPLLWDLACCTSEMISSAPSHYGGARLGIDCTETSPSQVDLLIVSGTVTHKLAPFLIRFYNQMAEPKYVIAMGACAISGGPFKEGCNVVSGIDHLIPVDVYIPGCPPRPEALLHGILALPTRSNSDTVKDVRLSHAPEGRDAPEGMFGPDQVSWGDLEGLVGPKEKD